MVMHISKHMNFANTTKEANFLFSHTYMPPKYTLLQINQHSFEYKTKFGRKDWVGFFLSSLANQIQEYIISLQLIF